MSDMKKLALLVLAFLAACSPTPTTTSTSPDAPSVTNPTPVPQDVNSTPVILPTMVSGEAGLWLQITSPLDEAVVDAPQLDVLGFAPAGSVISINDEILLVGADGQFRTIVLLEEGPNLIEIVASDENGNETSALLTVTYEP
jgi:hypothetical protein